MLCHAAPPKPLFDIEQIDDAIEVGYGLAIADVDGDGKQDILLVDKREIAWYANPTWEKHVMAKSLTLRDNVCIAATDVDGDGKAEIAIGANWNPGETTSTKESGAVYYLARPEDPTMPWTPVSLVPHEPTVHRMHWMRDRGGANLVVQPLHGRGNKAGTGEVGAKTLTYRIPKNPEQRLELEHWKVSELTELSPLHQTHNFEMATVSGLFGGTALIGAKEGLLSLDIGGKPEGSEFVFKASDFPEGDFEGIGEIRQGPRYIHRGSGIAQFTTIEPMHGNNVVVYELTGSVGDAWKFDRTVIDDSLNQGHALACADLFGLDRQQIVAGWRKADVDGKTGIRIYTWLEDESRWDRHQLDSEQMACEDLKVADLNGDGKQDIIACGRSTKNVRIYWNLTDQGRPPALAGGWKKHIVWEAKKKGGGPPAAATADYDGDGHPDIAFAVYDGDHMLPGPDFDEDILIRKATPGLPSRGIHSHSVDMDADGDADFVVGARSIYWLRNPGGAAARTQPWEFGFVDKEIKGVHCVMPADVDGDGDVDLMANEFTDQAPVPNSILWYDQTVAADGKVTLKRHAMAAGDAPGGNHYMGFGDLDGDGHGDFACGAKGRPFMGGNWFAWWKNPGGDAMRSEPWKKTFLAEGMIGATCIEPADLDGDGDLDLLATCGHGSGVLWFRNKGKAASWETIDIDPRLSRPHCLTLGDIDGDGDIDAATTSASADRRTVWYENDGAGHFAIHDIDDDQVAYSILAADLDSDGDLDLLIGGKDSGTVVWYENRLNAAAAK